MYLLEVLRNGSMGRGQRRCSKQKSFNYSHKHILARATRDPPADEIDNLRNRPKVYLTQLADRSGRQRVNVSWGEQFHPKPSSTRFGQRAPKVLDGIKYDNVELVRNALCQKASDPQQRLEGLGYVGAPFSYANAGVFTQEQVDLVVDDLRKRTREANAKARRFVSKSEWISIDEALGEVGTYTSVFLSRATAGDTGLHLALTLGSLRVAELFVEEGCDVAAVNENGISATDILSENFEKVMNLVEHIGQLEEDYARRGTTVHLLAHEEKERVVRKANEYRSFAHGMACSFVDRLLPLANLEEEAKFCEMKGRDMDPVAVRELSLCVAMSRNQKQCEAIRDRDHPMLPPLDTVDLELKAGRFMGAVFRSGDRGASAVCPRGRKQQSETLLARDEFPIEREKSGCGSSLASRVARCIAPPPSQSHNGIHTHGTDTGGAYFSQRMAEKALPTDTVVTTPSSASTLDSTVEDSGLASPAIGRGDEIHRRRRACKDMDIGSSIRHRKVQRASSPTTFRFDGSGRERPRCLSPRGIIHKKRRGRYTGSRKDA